MRIAYVEDNAINLALVQRIATMSGHVITSYTEGETALVGLSQQTYDLIMMDIELAGELNGLQVVRALRARGLTTPIIAVTAYAMMGDREKCLEAGCNDYLPKPLPIADFLALLAHYDTLSQSQNQPASMPVAKAKATGPVVPPPQLLVDSIIPAAAPAVDAATTMPASPDAPVTDVAQRSQADEIVDKANPIDAVASNRNSSATVLASDPASIVASPVQAPASPETPATSGS